MPHRTQTRSTVPTSSELMNVSQTTDRGGRALRPGFWQLVCAMTVLFWLGLPTHAHTQELDGEVEALLKKLDNDEANYEKKPVPPSSVDPVNLDVHWRLFKRVIKSEGGTGAEELQAFTRDGISLGHRNSPAYATAVHTIAASEMASGNLSEPQAALLYRSAQALAPDLPYPTLAYGAHLMRHNMGRLPAIVSLYFDGISQGYHWLDTRVPWSLKLATLGLLAFLGASILFLFAQLVRNFGIVVYDLSRLLPAGFSSNQTVILAVALIIVPGLLLRSSLLSVLIMLAVLSLVQNLNERVVTLLIFGMLLALPTIDQHFSRQITWPSSEAQRIFHAQYLHCDADCESDLEARWLDSTGQDPALTYANAYLKYRHGTPQDLENLLAMLDEVEAWPEAMSASVENLRGAAWVALAQPDRAIVHLEAARAATQTRAKSIHAAASFNLMRAYQMDDARSSASSAYDDAIRTDLSALRAHLALERRDVNSFLIVKPLPTEIFWQRHLTRQQETVSLITPVWQSLAGHKVGLERTPLLGGIGILIVLLGLPLWARRLTSTPCPSCGMARDPEDAPQTGGHRYCLPCYQTFVSGASFEYSARVHNERVSGRRERFQEFLRRALSLLMPGTGHCQSGHGLYGFLVIFTTLFGLALLWQPMGVWRAPHEILSQNWAGQQTIAWILVAIGASIGLSAAFRGIRPTQVSGGKNAQKTAANTPISTRGKHV